MRVLSFIVILVFCTSCQFFSSEKNDNTPLLDTVITLNKVDTSPFFLACKDKSNQSKTNCFRETIHLKIAQNLAEHHIKIKDSITDIIDVELIISSLGNIKLHKVNSSKDTQKHLPELDSLLQISIGSLPKIYPATKRGIPVTTQYNLPIRILLKE